MSRYVHMQYTLYTHTYTTGSIYRYECAVQLHWNASPQMCTYLALFLLGPLHILAPLLNWGVTLDVGLQALAATLAQDGGSTPSLSKCNNSRPTTLSWIPHSSPTTNNAYIRALCPRIATQSLHKDTTSCCHTEDLLQRERMWICQSVYKWMWHIQMYTHYFPVFLLHPLGNSALKRSHYLLSVNCIAL